VATRRKRIVDQVWSEANALSRTVSAADRNKLNQYLDSIRDLESKLEKTLLPKERSWTPPQAAKMTRPDESGIPANHQQHLRMMMQVLLLALQTDSTRVATFVMGHSISRIVFDFIDKKLKRNHHDYSHHRNDPEKIAGYNQITSWFAGECAWLLQQMSAIDEGDGTLLDNSIVLFGSGMKDGNVHEPVDIPIALFGSCRGQLKTGRKLQCPDDSLLAQLHLSLLDCYGIKAENFNGVTNQPLGGLLS
jgi:hypothetical protein